MFYLQGVQLLYKMNYSDMDKLRTAEFNCFPPLQQRHLARQRGVLEPSMTVDQPFAC